MTLENLKKYGFGLIRIWMDGLKYIVWSSRLRSPPSLVGLDPMLSIGHRELEFAPRDVSGFRNEPSTGIIALDHGCFMTRMGTPISM